MMKFLCSNHAIYRDSCVYIYIVTLTLLQCPKQMKEGNIEMEGK